MEIHKGHVWINTSHASYQPYLPVTTDKDDYWGQYDARGIPRVFQFRKYAVCNCPTCDAKLSRMEFEYALRVEREQEAIDEESSDYYAATMIDDPSGRNHLTRRTRKKQQD